MIYAKNIVHKRSCLNVGFPVLYSFSYMNKTVYLTMSHSADIHAMKIYNAKVIYNKQSIETKYILLKLFT